MGTDAVNISKFFAEASDRLRHKLPDPARDEGDIGSYLTDRARREAISKIASASSRCTRAEQLFARNDARAAGIVYREVFGDAFPR